MNTTYYKNQSALNRLFHSAGFLPLLFIIVSISLWLSYINKYYQISNSDSLNRSSLTHVTTRPPIQNTSIQNSSNFSDERLSKQNIIYRPEERIKSINALTKKLMIEYQQLQNSGVDQGYLDSLDKKFFNGDSESLLPANTNLTNRKLTKQTTIKTINNKPSTLQLKINKLLNYNRSMSDEDDQKRTDYMNNQSL